MKWAALFPKTTRRTTSRQRRRKRKSRGNQTRRTASASLPSKPGKRLTRNQGGKEASAKGEGISAKGRVLFALGPFPLLSARLAFFLPIPLLHSPTDLFTDEGIEK